MKMAKLTNADYFILYDIENPKIYEAFKAFANQLIIAGATRLSANLIFERIRWETTMHGNDGFKLNNNYRPYYARKFMNDFPEYDGWFGCRLTESEK